MPDKAFEVYETTELNQPIEKIEFDPTPLNEDAQKTVFINNEIDKELEVTDVSVQGENIQVEDFDKNISSDESGKLLLSANPKSNNLDGLKGEIEIEAQYIVRPN